MTPIDIKPEMSRESFGQLIAPLRNGSLKLLNFSTIHRRRDGSTYPVDVNLQHTESEDQALFVAVVRDVSERTKMNEGLLLRDRAMSEVVSGILITDATVGENRVIYANAAMEKMTGYTREKIIGQRPHFLWP